MKTETLIKYRNKLAWVGFTIFAFGVAICGASGNVVASLAFASAAILQLSIILTKPTPD